MFRDINLYFAMFDAGHISYDELSWALNMHHPDPKIGRAYIMNIWSNLYKKDFLPFFSRTHADFLAKSDQEKRDLIEKCYADNEMDKTLLEFISTDWN